MSQREMATFTLILAPIIAMLAALLGLVWGRWLIALPLFVVALSTAVVALSVRGKINDG